MKNFIISAILLSILFASCSKSEVPIYTDFSGRYYGKWVDASGNTGNVSALLKEWNGDYNISFDYLLVATGYNKMERIPCEKGEIARIKLSNKADIYPDKVGGIPFETEEAQKYIPLQYRLYEYKGKKVIESLAPSTSGLRVIR